MIEDVHTDLALSDSLATAVKAKFICPPNQKVRFSNSACTLTVSVGQPKFETDYLIATLAKINESFASCNIMVCDLLQRHTYKILHPGISDERAWQQAEQSGQYWLNKYEEFIGELTIPHNVTLWKHWLQHERYADAYHRIIDHFKSNDLYRNEIKLCADAFVARIAARHLNVDPHYAHAKSVTYLLEECAAMILSLEAGYNFEIYPANRNRAMTAKYNDFIRPYHPNLLKPIGIKFRTRRNSL